MLSILRIEPKFKHYQFISKLKIVKNPISINPLIIIQVFHCISYYTDFSTLYTTIPHQKLKKIFTSIIQNDIPFTKGNRTHKYYVLGHEETCFVKEQPDSKLK